MDNAARTSEGGRRPRSDGLANRERLLAVAAGLIRREGADVPLAAIAAEAGVGVGTLYRHFPSRDALLAALTDRSFRLVLAAAHLAADSDEPPIEALRHFLNQTIEHGAELVLPMHGGPVLLYQDTVALRAEVRRTLGEILHRGQDDGTIRSDLMPVDVIMFGAMIAQPLPHATNWKRIARRQATIFLDGVAPPRAEPLPDREVDR